MMLSFGALAVNRYKSVSSLVLYFRMQLISGIFSVYNIVLTWNMVIILTSSDQGEKWRENKDFIFVLLAFDILNFVLVLISRFHIKKLIQERQEYLDAIPEIADVVGQDKPQKDEDDEIVTVKVDISQVPQEWNSLYSENDHVV